MHHARLVRLDGVEQPCVLLSPHGEIPEELVVDFGDGTAADETGKRGPTTYRLQPSSATEGSPAYRELFDE